MSRPGLVFAVIVGWLACAAPAFAGPVDVVLPGPGPFAGRVPLRATLGPAAAADTTSVEFRVRGTLVAVDDAAPYSAEFDTTTVSDGPADLTATTLDANGRTRTSEPVATVIDNTAPVLSVTGPDRQFFAPGTVQAWAVRASDATAGLGRVGCSLVPAGTAPDFNPCPAGGDFSARDLAEGFYVLTVRAFDRAGNWSEAVRRIAIDATPPLTRFTTGVRDGGATTDTSVSLGFQSNEAGARFECRVVPAPFAACAPPFALSGLTPGDYTVEVRSIDTVGNLDATPARRTFTVLAPAAAVAGDSVPPDPGAPTPGSGPEPEPEQLTFTLTYKFFPPTARSTRLVSLIAKHLPSGSTVTARLAKKKLVRPAATRVSLKALIRKPLRAGTRITIEVSRPGALPATKVLRIRARRAPLVS